MFKLGSQEVSIKGNVADCNTVQRYNQLATFLEGEEEEDLTEYLADISSMLAVYLIK